MQDIETRTIAKVTARLLPFLIVCYFIAYLDRVNVGFAALTMNKDLGLSQTAFGFGAGIFFFAYFLFEVPSNLALDKFGARKWIARIMITWGLLSGLMAAIPWIGMKTGLGNEYSFYLVRVLLGFAEAGFFPGIIFYLTLWFPALYRARIVGYFMAAIPLSSVIGAPLSSHILSAFEGVSGITGWQWLFIIEAAPAIVLAFVVLGYLTDRPADAAWLEADERAWLAKRIADEDRQRATAQHFTIGQALTNPRVIALALVYFGAVACNYGVGYFMPQIVKAFGVSTDLTGWIVAIPYVVGTVGMVWYGRRSDAKKERKGHAAFALALCVAGYVAAAFISDPLFKMIAITIAAFGTFAVLPVFWTLPTAFLSGSAAAAGIAIINALGNLSGFAGPFAMGRIADLTGSFSGGFLVIAGLAAMAMVIVLSLHHDERLEQAPEGRVRPAE